MALVFIMAAITYRYHNSILQQQKSIQNLYGSLNTQLSLIQKVAILASKLNQIQEEKYEKKIKEEILNNVNQLGFENEVLYSYRFAKKEQVEQLVTKGLISKKINSFIDYARKLVLTQSENSGDKRVLIEKILSSASGTLSDRLEEVFLDIEIKNNKALNSLSKVTILLISLCILEVLLIWVFVFNPLYKAIIMQNHSINESMIQAESANFAKTNFLANISHEIRTPMTAILGYAEILNKEKEKLSKQGISAIKTINRSSSHLLDLIDDILDVSKLEANKVEPIITKVDLVGVLNEVYSLINVKAAEKNIQLVFNNKGDVPKTIYTDKKLFKQILFNIVGNAIKFTERGFVELKCTFNDKNQKLEMLVKDTGIGLSKRGKGEIFKPFSQADTSKQRKYGGTGLGLVLSRSIARALDGDIILKKSQLHVGSEFLICINPGNINRKGFIEQVSTSTTQSNDEDVDIDLESHLKNCKVLVVDDAKENARLFKLYLKGAKAQVDLAYNGDQAIELAQKNNYDIILLDIQMPGKDGFAVIKELRKNGFDGPIKALTAHAMKEEKDRTKAAGFDGHIVKPVSAEELIRQCHTK